MIEGMKLTEKDKEQLMRAVEGTLESLTKKDFVAIYEILIDACKREKAELAERIMIESINGEDE